MKQFFTLLILSVLCFSAQSQDAAKTSVKPSKKFFVGLSYSYLSVDTKLTDMSLHSVWYDQDLETHDLTKDEINEINSYVDRNTQFNAICAEAGMSFLNKPGSKWHFDGTLLAGIGGTNAKILNNVTGSEEYKFKSGFSKFCFGLGFNVWYHFTPRWGLSARPAFLGTIGTTTDVTDNANLLPENFTQTGKDKYSSFYERISILATFTAGPVTIAAGPGFYWINSNHKYTIERTEMNTTELLQDEITSKTIGRSFLDGCINVEWKIVEPITFYAQGGIGNDLNVNAGIHFNF